MAYTIVHLELADWKVAQSFRQVARQRAFLEGLEATGRDTIQAEVLLKGLEDTLTANRAQRDLIRERLDAQRTR